MSPWVTFDTNAPSMIRNASSDYLDPKSLARAISGFLGCSEEDSYTTPLTAPAGWWRDMKVEQISILGADKEVFCDDILTLAKNVNVHNDVVQILVAPGEAHV
ncbi:hypothetical protein LTS18_007374 [Coniosporium uncinatum]|uniref:Uncharacterized protein n=1 Tax=Coniosporium uncinatum TaxID=93489 RepID=A0ACC3DCD0_9PEZI|nr:hypothetical protein LTS18_007374 [Coniosporium uncinatum]